MIDDRRLSALIGRVYMAADDPADLPDLMGDIAAWLDVELMLALDLDTTGRSMPHVLAAERGGDFRVMQMLDYQALHHLDDPGRDHIRRSGTRSGLYDVHLHLTPERRAIDPFERWRHGAGRVDALTSSWALEGSDRIISMSACRANGRDPLDAVERQGLADLFRHWRHARHIGARLSATALSRDPVILLDRFGHALAVSPIVEPLLGTERGLTLKAGRPLADDPRDQAALDRLLIAALRPADRGGLGGVIGLRRKTAPRPLMVEADPIPNHASTGPLAPGALLHLTDPDLSPPRRDVAWHALFGFTPAETRLARALLADESNLREIADGLGIAYATARTQAASLYQKAGVRGQVGLVKLLTRLEK